MDSGVWIGIKIAALYLQARSDNTNLVPSLLSASIRKYNDVFCGAGSEQMLTQH
jgi:hypothetical protein